MDKCPYCGAEPRPGDNFCLQCGNRLYPGSSSPQQVTFSDATIPAQDDWSGPAAMAPAGNWSFNDDDKTIAGTLSDQQLPDMGAPAIENPARLLARTTSSDTVQEYTLTKAETVIGRVPESDISFPNDLLVSRTHATITYADGNYTLQDEGSANGTLINNQPLAKMVPWTLQDGDKILIGDQELVFRTATPAGYDEIAESKTMFVPPGSSVGIPAVDEDATVLANDSFSTRTMDVDNQAVEQQVANPATEAPAPAAATPVETDGAKMQDSPTPGDAPQATATSPETRVTASSFRKLAQPTLPNMDALLAASAALNEQLSSFQQQLHASREAQQGHSAEIAQTADQLRASMRRLAERMDSTIASVARSRGELDWDGLRQVMQDVIGSPRDIGYAMEFARRAASVDKIFQQYQGVLNTLAECNSLLRGLIGEDV